MVILVETHQKKMAVARNKTFAVLLLCSILCGLMFGYTLIVRQTAMRATAESGLRETELRTECELWEAEYKRVMAKEEVLSALKSKPMTIGQAMEVVDAIANQREIPISIVLGIVEQESEFTPQAVSYKGARGLTQVLPRTIRYYIKDPMLLKQIDRPSVNVRAGLLHLAYLNSQYENWEKTLRAYFAGEDNAHNRIFDWYAKGVLRKATKYKYLE